MLTRIRKLLAPPIFEEDDHKTRIAAQLRNTMLLGIAVTLIYALAWLVLAPNQLERLLFVPPVLGLFVLLLALIRAARVRLAGLLFTIGSWIVVTLIVATAGGVRAPFYGMYTLIVLGAALYLGWRLAPLVAGFTMIVGLGMIYLANLGLISSPQATPLIAWLTQSTIMIFITAQAYVVTNNINHALAHASKEITERKQAEEALQHSRIELEQHIASLSTINEIAERLHRSLDLQQIANEAVDALVHYSQSPMVALFLLDNIENRLRVVSHYGFNSAALAVGSILPLEGSLSGLAVRRKEVVTSEEIQEDDRVEPAVRQALVSQGLHSGVSIPILFQDEVLGVVNLVFAEKYVLNDSQRDTLMSIGKTIGLAVANARHVARIESEVAERKRAEEELQLSEERFRSLSQAAFEGIMIHKGGVILDANAAFANLFGYPDAKDLIGKNGLEVLSFTPESREKIRQIIPLNSSQLYEIQVVRPDGTTFSAETQGREIMYRGQRARVIAMRDITERKRAEEALHESEAQLASVIASAMDAIIATDVDQHIVLFNTAAERMFHCSATDVIGQPLDRFIPERHRAAHQLHVRKFGETGFTSRTMNKPMPLSGVRADGEEFPIEASISRVVGVGHTLYMVILRDITERKRAERVQEVIHSISQAAVATENLQDLYRSIHQALGQLMSVENFYIALYDSNKDLISFPYFVDERDEHPSPQKPSRGLTEYVLHTGRPLLAKPEVFAQLVQQGEVELMGVDSVDWLGVPLKIGTRVIGVMGVQSYTERVRFSLAETEILEVVSAQVATAIERKRAEEALRESEEQYRTLVETSPDAIALIALNGKVLACNQRAAEMWGYASIAEMLRTNAFSLIAPSDRERARQDLARGLQGVENREVQYTFLKKDGTLFIGELSANLLRDLNSTPKSFIAITRDITARKRDEDTLRVSEERYRSLFENMLNGFAYCQMIFENDQPLDFIYLDVNAAFETLTGLKNVVGRKVTEVIPGIRESNPELFEIYGRVALTGKPEGFETYVEPLGIWFFIAVYRPQRGYFVAIFDNITERKRTQEALQRYAARMEILHEIDRAILAAESLDEIAHATLSRMQHLVPSWHAQVVLFDLNSGEAFSVAAYENGNVAPFGRRVKLETLNLPESLWRGELSIIDDLTQLPLSSLRDQQLFSQGSRAHIDAPLMATGKVIGYLAFDSKQPNVFRGAVLDIVREVADQLAIAIQNAHLLEQTQIHAQELEVQAAALSRALDQQRELDRLQREFIQNVSHELRTPLSLVLGHAELLESNWLGNLQSEQQESIKVIARRARMLRKLVEDVIIVLEIENRELRQEPVNLARLVESLPVDFKTAAQAAGLTLNVEVAPDLPPLIGDEMALHRALDNLVGNALKFTPAGGHIDVRLSRSEQTLKLEVADSGVGIPSDQLPLIFNRFYQANGGTTRRFGGLGLGLALVKDVVDGHHGRIEVDSRVDEGTTFRIWLPLNGE